MLEAETASLVDQLELSSLSLSSLNLHFNQELFGETKWAIWGGSLCEKGLQAFSNRNETKQKNAHEEFFLSFLEL